MTTIRGLFAAGDGVGAAPHKFSSGSFTEGRLAAKAAVNFVTDHGETPTVSPDTVRQFQETIWAPLETFDKYKGESSSDEVNPNFINPKQGLVRLQKIMDEYAGGASCAYTTNAATLERGLELMEMFREDLKHLAARNRHELLRCWELVHRAWVGEAHMRHMLHRQETRWPGYYYRADYPALDDANWRVFVNSQYDAANDRWELKTKPYINLVK
jgi:adenylylsulfate reductase subunit A